MLLLVREGKMAAGMMPGMGQGFALYPFCSVASSGQTENLVNNPLLLGMAQH